VGTTVRPGERMRAQRVAEGDVTQARCTDRWSRASLDVRTVAYGGVRCGALEHGNMVARRDVAFGVNPF
jgi:hypothetical protein